jgi:hypothetical protein
VSVPLGDTKIIFGVKKYIDQREDNRGDKWRFVRDIPE